MNNKIEYDIALVGAGPANLSLALKLIDTVKRSIRIAILDKSKFPGSHLMSGAVSNPRVLDKLFPNWREDSAFPVQGIVSDSYLTVLGANEMESVPRFLMPTFFKKEGYAVLNISDLAAYMAAEITKRAAEKKAVVDFYNGFPAQGVVFTKDGVAGVKVDSTNDPDKDNLYAKLTVFGEKGFVSRDLISKFNLRKSAQTWAVGVKELWEIKSNLEGKVWHTVGYPLPKGMLGGGFVYGMKNNKLMIGMVIGLDTANPNIKPVEVLQNLKKHPWLQEILKGGKILKYGAAVLPEGGYYALPEKFAVSGAMFVGDALGVLDVRSFSGVDKSMESGIIAANIASLAIANNDFSESFLSRYKRDVMDSFIGKELYQSRYYRKTFEDYPEILNKAIPFISKGIDKGKGIFGSALSFGLCNPVTAIKLLGAKPMLENPSDHGDFSYPEDRTRIDKNYEVAKVDCSDSFDSKTVYSTADIVFYAHTHYEGETDHIEELSKETCFKCISSFDSAGKLTPCVGDCTAEVHQVLTIDGKRTHKMALENCVQCTTCELVCPEKNLRVHAALHGGGPDFSGM